MNRIVSEIFLHTCVVFCLGMALPLSAQQQLTILYTNDSHSRIEPVEAHSADKRSAGKGGFVRRATYIAQARAEDPDLLLFDSGDFSQGTPYYNLFRGDVEVKLMNAMKYDAVTIGNHEFDFGMDNLARLYRLAEFPIVCSNYEVTGTVLEGLVKPYLILERRGVKIGVLGLGVKLKGLVADENCEGVIYKDPVAVSNEIADFLKNQEKCDIVICLSHLGYRSSTYYPDSDQVLAQQSRNIDMILGGHSHTYLEEPEFYTNAEGKEVLVTQMGKNSIYVGRLDVTIP